MASFIHCIFFNVTLNKKKGKICNPFCNIIFFFLYSFCWKKTRIFIDILTQHKLIFKKKSHLQEKLNQLTWLNQAHKKLRKSKLVFTESAPRVIQSIRVRCPFIVWCLMSVRPLGVIFLGEWWRFLVKQVFFPSNAQIGVFFLYIYAI